MLTGELLAKVRKIEIKTRKLVEEITGGAYHSVFKGRGIEFSEVREYTPDDDIRDIDWNVTARMGTPYIKKYAEERELNVMLAVDASASGLFGRDADKREQMAEAAALLAFSAIRNQDKVGLLVFTDKTELYLPPRSGRSHGLRVIRELVAMEPEHTGTDIGQALDSLARGLKKRSVIFLISDFLDPKDYESKLKILSRRHDVIAFRIQDGAELQLPCALPGLTVEGLESGKRFYFDAGSRKRLDAYAAAAEELRDHTREICRHAKVDMIDSLAGEDLIKPLLRFFRGRRGKR
ncbi:MAG: DUF58 domain-containing protein [Lentisphaeria bacterium]|nr:DUF58 domain-containing protein [Lentisphaeria bacterium]